MKTRGTLVATALVSLGLVVGGSTAFGQDAGDDSPDTTVSPQPVVDDRAAAQEKLSHALEQQRLEDERIAAAGEAFESALSSEAAAQDSLLVSLTDPIAIKELVPELTATIDLDAVYVWLWDGVSLHPVIGEFTDGPHLDLGDPLRLEAYIKGEYLRFLDASIAGLEASLRAEEWDDEETRDAWEQQADEAMTLRAKVLGGELAIFGFGCRCAPADLVMLEKTTLLSAGSALRAVEEAGSYQTPIRPQEPLRDAIIAAEGEL